MKIIEDHGNLKSREEAVLLVLVLVLVLVLLVVLVVAGTSTSPVQSSITTYRQSLFYTYVLIIS